MALGANNYMAPLRNGGGNTAMVEVAWALVMPMAWAQDLIAVDPSPV